MEEKGAPTEHRPLSSNVRAADSAVPTDSDMLLARAAVCRHRPMPFESRNLAVNVPGTLMDLAGTASGLMRNGGNASNLSCSKSPQETTAACRPAEQ